MAYTYDQILNAQFENINAEQAQAAADLESARHAEDADRVNYAANAILQLDLQRNALVQRARGIAGQQAAQPVSKYGLSQEEREVAHASFTDRKDCPPMSLDDRERAYTIQKNKLAAMKANGTYSDQRG